MSAAKRIRMRRAGSKARSSARKPCCSGTSVLCRRRGFRSAEPRQARFEFRFHWRPFAGEDREVDGVAEIALRHPHMAAKRAFFRCTHLLHGGARAGVPGISLELDAIVVGIKGIREKEIL